MLFALLVLFAGVLHVWSAPWLAVAPLEASSLPRAESEAIDRAITEEWLRLGTVRVMERERLEDLLEEQSLQLSGLCGDSCQVQAAQVLGARFLVLGSATRIGQQYRLHLRLTDVTNGEILSSHSTDVRRTHRDLLGAVPGTVRALARKSESWLLRSDANELTLRKAAMVSVPAGSFIMGSDAPGSNRDEQPLREVAVNAFFLDSTEVSQAAYRRYTHRNPSRFKGCNECPVENVTWREANDYCLRLGKRLPTEAEWEYAARAGGSGVYFWGDSPRGIESYTGPLTSRSTFAVRSTLPNAWGLYEMAGNVSEWVQDWYSRDSYKWNLQKGPPEGSKKVQRGGHWYGNASLYRVARRAYADPDQASNQVGFRCAMDNSVEDLP